MNWLLFSLTAPILWVCVIGIDSFLVDKYGKEKGIGELMIMSSALGLLFAPIAFFLSSTPFLIKPELALLLIVSGIVSIFQLYPYFLAFSKGSAVMLMPLLQTIPIFSYILGLIFLGESLSEKNIVLSILILVSSILIGFDFGTND